MWYMLSWTGLAALMVILVIILLLTSTKFNFIAKFTYLYVTYMAMSVPISILCLPRPRHPDNGVLAAKIMRFINYAVGVEWVLDGVDRLKVDSGAIIVLNHQSAIDLLALMELWPVLKKAAPVAKKSLLYCGPFGLVAWLVGCIFIDRGSVSGRADVSKAGEDAKLSRTKLIVFPEGTRNSGKKLSMLPFKKGAFHVALDSKMPILPVVISQYDFLDVQNMSFRPGRAIIKVLPRIETDEYSKETIDDLIQLTRTRMLDTLKEISIKGPTSSPDLNSNSGPATDSDKKER